MKKYTKELIALTLAIFLTIVLPSFSSAQDQVVPEISPSPAQAQTVPDPQPTSSPGTQTQTAPAIKSTVSQGAQPPTETVEDEGVPVVLGDKTLFRIEETIESTSPEERVQIVNDRIVTLAQDLSIPIDAIQIGDQSGITVIFSGQTVVLRITEADARAANSTPQKLANEYLQILKASIEQYRQEGANSHSRANSGFWKSLRQAFQAITSLTVQESRLSYGRAILYTFIATIFLIICLLGIHSIFAGFQAKLVSRRSRYSPVRIRDFELLSAEQVADIQIGLTKNLRFVMTLGLLFIYIVIVFSFFPLTKRLGGRFSGYFFSALSTGWQAFVAYLPNLFNIALIIFVSYYILYFIKPIFSRVGDGTIKIPGFYSDWATPTYRLIEIFVFSLTAIIIFPYLPGFGSTAFQGVSIFLGVLVSLGSTAAISNAVAGIILIYTRAFQIGDRVKIADTLGNVEEKLLLVTRIRTFDNVIVTIPNALLLSSNINNYSASMRDTKTPIILSTTVTLGYEVPWRKIDETLTNAALATPNVLPDPAPFVFQTSLGDFSVSYELKVYTDSPTVMERIYSELHKNIQDKCNEANIEILSPTYSAVRDGNQSTIPETYLSDNYTTPGFNLHPLGNLFQIDLQLGGNNKTNNKSIAPDRPPRERTRPQQNQNQNLP